MEDFVIKDGKKLRLGYTTGSCAAAAAKAAAFMLLTGIRKETISLITPKGIPLELPVEDIDLAEDRVSCAVRKDSGDDPDVTDGSLVYAKVEKTGDKGVFIDGGRGVGRVTKPGLDQPVGSAAINSVPRKMIDENVRRMMEICDYDGGVRVEISIPDGVELARKTFNPRLGIVGGISILGTTGIVEPMSEQALLDTIRVELRQRRETGHKYVLLTPGNYGSDFIRDILGIDPGIAVQTSNFIGDSLDICRELGFRGALLVGHIGKIVKLGGGMLNTHSKYGDCRLDILAAQAGAAGLAPDRIAEMLECVSCDEGIRIMRQGGVCREALRRLMEKVGANIRYRAGETLEVACATFSKEYGLLCSTDNTEKLLKAILKEQEAGN